MFYQFIFSNQGWLLISLAPLWPILFLGSFTNSFLRRSCNLGENWIIKELPWRGLRLYTGSIETITFYFRFCRVGIQSPFHESDSLDTTNRHQHRVQSFWWFQVRDIKVCRKWKLLVRRLRVFWIVRNRWVWCSRTCRWWCFLVSDYVRNEILSVDDFVFVKLFQCQNYLGCVKFSPTSW